MTGMPLLKIDFIRSMLALAEPVPLTVAILMTKSLIFEESGADMLGIRSAKKGKIARLIERLGDLGLSGGGGLSFIEGERPVHVGLLHVPGGGGAAFGA